jgi:hypothetical protein
MANIPQVDVATRDCGQAQVFLKATGTGTTGDPFVPVFSTSAGTASPYVQGAVAHDAVDAVYPVKVGGYAIDPDTPPSAVASGDVANILTDLRGRTIVYLGSTLDSTNDSVAALGNVAHDAVDSGAPVKIGGYASLTAPTAVAAGDRVNAWFDLNGRGVVAQGVSLNAMDNYTVCQATNSTTAGTTFAALSPTASLPTASATRCVLTWTGRDNLLLMPFGVGSNNNTFKLRVTGWSYTGAIYLPTVLFDCTCTLTSSITGVAGQVPVNTAYMCDGIAAGNGIGTILASPADDTGVASLVVPVGNFQYVEVQFIINASVTSCNAMYATY